MVLGQSKKNLSVQAKAAFWALICGVIQKGINVVTIPIFTRIMSTEEFGQYNVFSSWYNVLLIVISLRICFGVFTQGLVKFEENKKSFASAMQGLTFVLVLIWTIIYLAFREYWNCLFSLNTVQMLAMLLMIWVVSAFELWAAVQKNEYRYKMMLTVTLVVSFLGPVLGILFIQIFPASKVTARILGMLIVEVAIYVFLFIFQIFQGKTFFDKKYWKYALSFNLPLVPHFLSQVLLNSADRIMIEKMIGASEAGIYALAYSVSMVLWIINNAISQTLTPWMYRKIKAKELQDMSSVAYTSLIVIAVGNFFLIALAPEAVKLFAPAQYYDAIWVIPPVAISVYYMFCYDLFSKFAFYFEKRLFITMASVVAAILNIILNYICIQKFGYIAAGYTTLVCYMICALGHYLFMNKVCNEFCDNKHPYNFKVIIMISTIFTMCGMLMLFTYSNVFIRYLIIAFFIIVVLALRKRIILAIRQLLTIKDEK